MGFFIKLIQQKRPPTTPLSKVRAPVPLSTSRPSAMKIYHELSDPQPIESALTLSFSLPPSSSPLFHPSPPSIVWTNWLVSPSHYFPIKHSENHGPDKTLELSGDICHNWPQSDRAKELPEVRLEGRGWGDLCCPPLLTPLPLTS